MRSKTGAPRPAVLLCAAAFLCAAPAIAQPAAERAAAEPGAISLYAAADDIARPAAASENWSIVPGQGRSVRNVTVPDITPIFPDPDKANEAAVLVFPGGGFMALAMDHEGYKVARRLADAGIAAFVVKYRLLPTPPDDKQANAEIGRRIGASLRDPAQKLENPDATADAAAALRLVRTSAQRWNIDPERIGAIGYSAGARTVMNLTLAAPAAGRPAFIGYIYGSQDAVEVPADAPPLFDAIAMDDPLYPAKGFPIVGAWRAAKRPVELHAYQKGGHGFGLGKPGTTNELLITQFTAWLDMQGFLTPKDRKKAR